MICIGVVGMYSEIMFSYVFVRLRNTNLYVMYICKTIIGWSNIYHAHYIAISFGNVRAADQLRNYTEPYPSIFILSAALDLHQLRRGSSGWRSCRLHDMYENFSLPAFMSFHVFFVYGREHFPIFLNVDYMVVTTPNRRNLKRYAYIWQAKPHGSTSKLTQ